MAILSQPTADFCNVSLPRESYSVVVDDVLDVAYECGAWSRYPGLVCVDGGGALKFGERGQVGWLSMSGGLLAALRRSSRLLDVLTIIGSESHRVTTLHACLDVVADAPSIVARLYRRAKAGNVGLTRKKIPASQVRKFTRVGHIDGRDTGTVYLGNRRRDVRAKVYDKRNELLDRAIDEHGSSSAIVALNDSGPLVRYELEVGRKVGATLRDVNEPASMFVHFMSGLLDCRHIDGVQPWGPHALGYEVGQRPEPNYARQLELLLEHSPDIKRAVTIADKLGREGRRYLTSKLLVLDASKSSA